MTIRSCRFLAVLLAGTALGLGAAWAAEGGGKGKGPAVPQVAINPPAVKMGTPSGPQGDTWDTIKELTDFNGNWNVRRPPNSGDDTPPDLLPLQPTYRTKLVEQQRKSKAGEEVSSLTAQCIPTGMPQMMASPHGLIEVLLTPGHVHMILEDGGIRRIQTAPGAKIDQDPDVTFAGRSVGHWENKVLFVDTRGLDLRNQHFYGFASGKLEDVKEKIELINPTTMMITTTITDPVVFKTPWTRQIPYLKVKDEAMERLCIQNNRDVDFKTGAVGFDLTPPPGITPPPK